MYALAATALVIVGSVLYWRYRRRSPDDEDDADTPLMSPGYLDLTARRPIHMRSGSDLPTPHEKQSLLLHDVPTEVLIPEEEASKYSEDATHCEYVLDEIRRTESTYLKALAEGLGVLDAVHPLRLHLQTICTINTSILDGLNALNPLTMAGCVAVFEQNADPLKLYIPYIQQYQQYLRSTSNDNNNNNANISNARAAVESLLITPVQRIPRYVLFMEDLLKHMRDPNLQKIRERFEAVLARIRNVAVYCNEKQRDFENANMVVDLHKSLKIIQMYVQSRRLLKRQDSMLCIKTIAKRRTTGLVHGRPSEEGSKRKSRDIILFSDMVVVAKLKKRGVSYIFNFYEDPDVVVELTDSGFLLSDGTTFCHVLTDDVADRQVWVQAMQDAFCAARQVSSRVVRPDALTANKRGSKSQIKA